MKVFKPGRESLITKAIVSEFTKGLEEHAKTDVIVIGGDPSDLMASRELSRKGVKVLLVERNNYLGGGFWIGGYLMNTLTVRSPGEKVLDEFNIPYKKFAENLYITNGPHACSKLIASTCESGVRILNMTRFDDVVLREKNRVAGAVVNWTAVAALPKELTCYANYPQRDYSIARRANAN